MAWLEPTPLEAAGVRLVPAGDAHWEGLCRSADDATFLYFTSAPSELTPQALEEHFRSRPERPRVDYAAILTENKEIVGSSAFYDVQEAHRGLEVGYTWVRRDQRGGPTNAAMKLAMMEHAFGAMRAIRVQFKTDERNLASQRALAKIGAREEGRMRNHRIMPDGHWRTTVFFSVTVEEWPAVRSILLSLVGQGHPVDCREY